MQSHYQNLLKEWGGDWGIAERDKKKSQVTFQPEECLSKVKWSNVAWGWPSHDYGQNSMRGKIWSCGHKSPDGDREKGGAERFRSLPLNKFGTLSKPPVTFALSFPICEMRSQ